MVDDLKYIHVHDPQDALGIAEKQANQLDEVFKLDVKTHSEVGNVVLAGMGGSALAGLVSQSWLDLPVPFEIVRNYTIPAYVSRKTLFIASSYSGNTEEEFFAIKQAENRGAIVIVVTSGGKLLEYAKQKGHQVLEIPAGYQPRYTTLYNLKALATIFDDFGLSSNATESLVERKSFVAGIASRFIPTVPTKDNSAKQIALDLVGKSIVVYSGPLLYPIAYKWKINFNENAKHISWVNQYPEFDHNELIGWTKQPVDKPYAVIDLRSNLDLPQIQERFILTQQLLSGLRPSPTVVQVEGKSLLDQLLWALVLGDFTSLYLALLNKVNPTPVNIVEKFKHELAEQE